MGSDAIAIAAGIEAGTLQPESVCDYYLSRIKRLDCVLNAFVEVYTRRARSQVRRIQAAASPLAFVPIAIKDAHAIRGSRMRFGSAATQHLFSPIDDVLIRRLRRAGLVFLGKTAMSEFGVLPTCEPEIHVPTRNPFRLDLSPGGSSGGSAAAVAAGLAPIALGSDGGGSIRIPAAFCGLVGFKPSRGLVTNPFGRDSRELMWTCGPLTKSVRDAAALLDVLVNPGAGLFSHGFAAWSRLRAGRRLFSEAPNFSSSLSGQLAPLKIRFTTESPLSPTNPSTATAVERVASLLEKAGHQVDAGRPLKGSTSVDEFLPLWQANTAQAPVRRWDQTETLTRWLGEAGRSLDEAQVSLLAERIKARVLAWFGDADVWVTPTVAPDPPRIGALRGLKPREAFEAAAQYGAFTAVFNVTGQPAVSLPAGVSPSGLPIGIQLIARLDEDMLLMALASRLESMLGFRAPPTVLPEARTDEAFLGMIRKYGEAPSLDTVAVAG